MKWYNPLNWFKKKDTIFKYNHQGYLVLITKEQNFTLTVKSGKYTLDVTNSPTVPNTSGTPASKF